MSDPQKLLPIPDRIYVERDETTNVINAYSCKGMGEEFVRASVATPPEDNTLKLVEAVLHEACRVVDADTYKHPTLSRADAVAAGVAGLHDAVRAWLSAQPPSAALSHGEDDNGK